MQAKQFFAPLRNPALIGVLLVLTIGLSWILAVSDPTAIRKRLGIAKYYQAPGTNDLMLANGTKVTTNAVNGDTKGLVVSSPR